jgi:hypothetical protein
LKEGGVFGRDSAILPSLAYLAGLGCRFGIVAAVMSHQRCMIRGDMIAVHVKCRCLLLHGAEAHGHEHARHTLEGYGKTKQHQQEAANIAHDVVILHFYCSERQESRRSLSWLLFDRPCFA